LGDSERPAEPSPTLPPTAMHEREGTIKATASGRR